MVVAKMSRKKEWKQMKKQAACLTVGLGVVLFGAFYLAKKTGLLEDDSHLYDAFDSTL